MQIRFKVLQFVFTKDNAREDSSQSIKEFASSVSDCFDKGAVLKDSLQSAKEIVLSSCVEDKQSSESQPKDAHDVQLHELECRFSESSIGAEASNRASSNSIIDSSSSSATHVFAASRSGQSCLTSPRPLDSKPSGQDLPTEAPMD